MIQNKALFLIALNSTRADHVQHNQAVHNPTLEEESLLVLIESWYNYAEIYSEIHSNKINSSPLLGTFWKDTALNLLAFIRACESQRLIKGILSHIVCAEVRKHGMELPMLNAS